MSHLYSAQLLAFTVLAGSIVFLPLSAQAADINITTNVAAKQTIAANDDTLSVTGAGDLSVAGDTAVDTDGKTGVNIIVNTTGGGISSSGGFTAIGITNGAATINQITITDGLVTSDEDGTGQGTIDFDGATSSPVINIGVNGSVTNTFAGGGGGNAINFDNQNTAGVDYTATINNAGNISTENIVGATSIEFEDNGGGSSLTVNNTGTINSGALGQAMQLSANNSLDLDNTGSGAITGRIFVNTGTVDILNADNATINGNIIAVAGATTVNVTGGTITGDLTLTSGTSNIDVNGGVFNGNINLGNNGTGALDVTTGTLSGNVTMGNAAQVFTYTGGTFAGTVNGAGQFHVDTSLTNQRIGGSTAVTEVEVGSGAILTVGADIDATNVNIDSGTIDLGTTVRAIMGNLTSGAVADSKVDVQSAAHTVSGTFTTNAGDTIDVDIEGLSAGKLTSGGMATVATGTLLDIDLTNATVITNGTSYTIIDGTGGTNVMAITDANININGTGSNKTALLTFTTTGGEDLTLNVARASINTVATTGNTPLADALDTIGTSGGSELDTLFTTINNTTSSEEINALLESASPEMDNSQSQGVFEATGQSLEVVNERIANFRSGREFASLSSSGQTGLSAGDSMSGGYGMWIQGFGGTADQGNVDGIFGYEADTYGMAVGADKEVGDDWALGISCSYSRTDIDNNSGTKDTDIDSYQLNIYGSWERLGYYVDTIAGAAFNQYETTRRIIAPTLTAKGDFEGQTYMGQVSGGRLFTLTNGIDVTPNAGLLYAHNRTDNYTETGAGAQNISINQDNADRLEGKIGVNIAKTFEQSDMKIRPELKLAVAHDFIGDEQQATANFAGVGTTFRTEAADVEKTSFKIGAGVDFMNRNNVTFSANYDFETKSDYKSHIGSLKVRYEF
ncbi:MAG: autotransporter domain-containing protein [Rhodospirillales bacterium]|nr:autotransporter domain-containing protein [Rhodospirillales bacterium]MCB9973488.1 autotransporter domain-containing protein [Rhodospirillales bacterium]MCB9980200.1 autotransporter domain-containing protein [Rhodospirillales bacterium]